jgi:PAS domain S-box-containing protein
VCSSDLVNERMCEMTGYALEEMLGMASRHLYFSEQEYRRVGKRSSELLLSRGTAAMESLWRRKDGARLDVLLNSTALNGQDLTAGLVFTALDITDSKQARELVRRNEEKYRLILEAMPDPVVLYDVEGRVVYLNPAFTRVFGWSLEEVAGRKLDYVPDEEWPQTTEMLEMMMRGQTASDFETRRFDKQGNVLNVAMNWSIWRDEKGERAGSVVALRDVTEHKRMVAQLEQSRKMEAIGTLAGGIAHDFNNVLQAISGNVQILLMRPGVQGATRAVLAGVDNLTQRAAEMIQQLLTISRKREVKLRPMDLNQEISQVCRLLERIIPRMIAIELNLAEDLWPINGDQAQLEQIILNLAANAADAMPEGGGLTFQTEDRKSVV